MAKAASLTAGLLTKKGEALPAGVVVAPKAQTVEVTESATTTTRH
jgi:hypothetical protein